MTCPDCGAMMNSSSMNGQTTYVCPDCGYAETVKS